MTVKEHELFEFIKLYGKDSSSYFAFDEGGVGEIAYQKTAFDVLMEKRNKFRSSELTLYAPLDSLEYELAGYDRILGSSVNMLLATAMNLYVLTGDRAYFDRALLSIFGSEATKDAFLFEEMASERFCHFCRGDVSAVAIEVQQAVLLSRELWQRAQVLAWSLDKEGVSPLYKLRGVRAVYGKQSNATRTTSDFGDEQLEALIENGVCNSVSVQAVWDWVLYKDKLFLLNEEERYDVDLSKTIFESSLGAKNERR